MRIHCHAVHRPARLVRLRAVGLRHELARVQLVVRARRARARVDLVQIHVVVVADELLGGFHVQAPLVLLHHLLQPHPARALVAAHVVPPRVGRLQVPDARVVRRVEPDEVAVLGALHVHVLQPQFQSHDFVRARVAKQPRVGVVARIALRQHRRVVVQRIAVLHGAPNAAAYRVLVFICVEAAERGLRSKQPPARDKHVRPRMDAARKRLHEDAVPAARAQVQDHARVLPAEVTVKRVVRAHDGAVGGVVPHRDKSAAPILGPTLPRAAAGLGCAV